MRPPNPLKCTGFFASSAHALLSGNAWVCGYGSDIPCDECRYGSQGGQKDPEVYHDLATKKAKPKPNAQKKR